MSAVLKPELEAPVVAADQWSACSILDCNRRVLRPWVVLDALPALEAHRRPGKDRQAAGRLGLRELRRISPCPGSDGACPHRRAGHG